MKSLHPFNRIILSEKLVRRFDRTTSVIPRRRQCHRCHRFKRYASPYASMFLDLILTKQPRTRYPNKERPAGFPAGTFPLLSS